MANIVPQIQKLLVYMVLLKNRPLVSGFLADGVNINNQLPTHFRNINAENQFRYYPKKKKKTTFVK